MIVSVGVMDGDGVIVDVKLADSVAVGDVVGV